MLGNVIRALHMSSDLNLVESTIGVTHSRTPSGTLEGNASGYAFATLHGTWVPTVQYYWSTIDLLLPFHPIPVPSSTSWSYYANQSKLASMAQGGYNAGTLSLQATDASGLAARQAELRIYLHAQRELLRRDQDVDELVSDVPYMENGMVVRHDLGPIPSSLTISSAVATTHLPNVVTINPSGSVDISDIVKLGLGISIQMPADTQDQYTHTVSRTWTFPAAAYTGQAYEVRARVYRKKFRSHWAEYDANGYVGDTYHDVTKPDPTSFSLYVHEVGTPL